MKIAAYQASISDTQSIDTALASVAAQVRFCEAESIDMLCCPEAVLGGLADYHARPVESALDPARLQQLLTPLASDTVTTIVGFTEAGPGGVLFNSAAVFSKGVVVGVYRKHHPALNRSVYSAGTDTPVFEVGDVTFGIVICLDSRFPEPMQTLAARGAQVIFIPTNNGMPEQKGGAELVAEARACDVAHAKALGVLIVRADVAGRHGELVSYGSSAIVAPGGRVLATGDALTEGLIGTEI